MISLANRFAGFKARLYARFSPRPNANECSSIHDQFVQMDRWSIDHQVDVQACYWDWNVSGKLELEDRQGLCAAVHDLQPGELLVAVDAKRIARNVGVSLYVEQCCEDRQAFIHCLDGITSTIDDTAELKFARRVLYCAGDYQRESGGVITSRRMIQQQNEDNRRINGRQKVPYGKRAVDHFTEDGQIIAKLEPDEHELAGIQYARTLASDPQYWNDGDLRPHAIAKALALAGYTNRGGGIMHSRLIRRFCEGITQPEQSSFHGD